MASHISFSIFSSLWDRISMSLLIFWLVIRAYIWVVFKSVCPKRRLTVSVGAPCESSTVVAFVCRATRKVIGTARKSVEVKIKRKSFEMSNVSVFC